MSGTEISQKPSSAEATIAKPAQPTEQQAALSRDNQPGGQSPQTLDNVKAQTAAMVAGGTLPEVQLQGAEGPYNNSTRGAAGAPGADTSPSTSGDAAGNPAHTTPTEGPAKATTTPTDGTSTPGTTPTDGTTPPPLTLVDNGQPLTQAQVNQEAQKLEPMVQQFMNSSDYGTQVAAIKGLQSELTNVATHGAASTTQVLNQLASDLKSDKSIDAQITPGYLTDGTPSLLVTNNKLHPGEDLPTDLGTDVTSKGVFTAGGDGHETRYNLSTTMVNGKPGNTVTNQDFSPAPKPAPSAGESTGGYSGRSDYSAPAPAPQTDSMPYTAQVYGPDGSFQGIETVQQIN